MVVKRAVGLLGALCLVACAEGFSQPTDGSGGSAGSPVASGAGGSGGEAGGVEGGQSSTGGTSGEGGAGGSPTCDESPCKLVQPQCGCDAGDKCTVNGAGTRSCIADGPAALGAACGAGNDCVAGGLCLGGGSTGYCGQFCAMDADCGGAICAVQLSDGMNGSLPGVTLCTTSCDPGTGSGCPSGLGCVIGQEAAGAMRFFFSCFGSGAGLEASACTTAADCAVGYGCYNDSTGTAGCYHNCNVNAPSCGAQTCLALTDQSASPIIVNGYALGVCQ